MAKSIMQLEAEIKKMELEKEQLMHKLQLLENRKNYLEQKSQRKSSGSVERAERSHRLITRGAVIESILPETKNLMEQEFYQIMEFVFSDEYLKAETVRQIGFLLSWRGGGQ